MKIKTLMAQNRGAGKKERVRASFFCGLKLEFLYAIFITAVLGSSGLSAQEMKLRFMLAGVDIEAITDIHIMKMNAVLLDESCAAIGITVSGRTPEVLRALGAAKEKGASTILFRPMKQAN